MRYRIGMVIDGIVTGIQPYGAFVALDSDTQGLIHISECHHGFVSDVGEFLKVGDHVRVMVIDIDEYTQKISLSMRCLEKKFDFSRPKKSLKNQHKKYWTNRHYTSGFHPIEEQLPTWIADALADLEKNK